MTVIWLPFWIGVGYILMSFIEHYLHKYQMHKKGWMNTYSPWIFDNHHLIHHPGYRKDFQSCDPIKNKRIGLFISLFHSLGLTCVPLAILAYYYWVPALGLFLMILLNTLLWNLIHQEMHDPQEKFFSHWGLYRKLYRHHLLHHWHPNRNYNTAFPLADWVLGTLHRPTPGEIGKLRDHGFNG